MSTDELLAMERDETNYRSLTDDPEAEQLVQDMVDPSKGWIRQCSSLAEATAVLGQAPVVSQLGLVVKPVTDKYGKQTGANKRIILNATRSGANQCSTASQRITLPRPFDTVNDALKLARAVSRRVPFGPRRRVEQAIADYEDAYWSVPLHPAERPLPSGALA